MKHLPHVEKTPSEIGDPCVCLHYLSLKSGTQGRHGHDRGLPVGVCPFPEWVRATSCRLWQAKCSACPTQGWVKSFPHHCRLLSALQGDVMWFLLLYFRRLPTSPKPAKIPSRDCAGAVALPIRQEATHRLTGGKGLESWLTYRVVNTALSWYTGFRNRSRIYDFQRLTRKAEHRKHQLVFHEKGYINHMRNFEYYLFENFDPDHEASNPNNPRRFLSHSIDPILDQIIDGPDDSAVHNTQLIQQLLDGGILRLVNQQLMFDCPIFLREDATVLSHEVAVHASALTDLLSKNIPLLVNCCSKIKNGFSVRENLYHILCGMVFDGRFFDFLSNRGVVSTSRLHSSGLDYLTVIYETCRELQAFSNRLLCSYNRFANETCSLQSFGDSNGNRFDFYRFCRLLELGKLSPEYRPAERLWKQGQFDKNSFLSEIMTLIHSGRCSPAAMSLLEVFGYLRNGKICVPVYTSQNQDVIEEIEIIVEHVLGEAMSQTLFELSGSLQITSVIHGVPWPEIANELYHILFGTINQQLVDRNLISEPQFFPGQGRYRKCMEIYEPL